MHFTAGEIGNKKSEWKKFEKNLKKAVEKLLDKGDESDEEEDDKKESMEEEEDFNRYCLNLCIHKNKQNFSYLNILWLSICLSSNTVIGILFHII